MGKFQVDVVATPRLDLCSAAARDLQYRDANGKYPMASRSQMAKEQEKLNKFLQYVNESFIIKGFSKRGSGEDSGGIRGFSSVNSWAELWDQQEAKLGTFRISHGDGAQIVVFFSVTGDGMAAGSTPAVLEIGIWENDSRIAVFQQNVDGYFTMSAPYLLINRSAGLTKVSVTAVVTGGEVYVDQGRSAAQAVVLA